MNRLDRVGAFFLLFLHRAFNPLASLSLTIALSYEAKRSVGLFSCSAETLLAEVFVAEFISRGRLCNMDGVTKAGLL